MDREDIETFAALCRAYDRESKPADSIGTMGERSLHAIVKRFFCDERFHEQKIGKFVADAFDGQTIYEIQTGSFSLLRKKIAYYLEETPYDVTVVRPLAASATIVWVDPEDGSTQIRRSPKKETLLCALPELFYLHEYLASPRLHFAFPLLHVRRVRLRNGYGKQKKSHAEAYDTIPETIRDTIWLHGTREITDALPDLPARFDRAALARALRLGTGRRFWAAQQLLLRLDLIREVGRDGRRILYERNF